MSCIFLIHPPISNNIYMPQYCLQIKWYLSKSTRGTMPKRNFASVSLQRWWSKTRMSLYQAVQPNLYAKRPEGGGSHFLPPSHCPPYAPVLHRHVRHPYWPTLACQKMDEFERIPQPYGTVLYGAPNRSGKFSRNN